VFTSPLLGEDAQSLLLIYRLNDCLILHFPGVGDYYLWKERILCHAPPSSDRALLETHFFVTVLPIWLEGKGVPALHASAVSSQQGAVVFLAHSNSGKSALAMAWLQAGRALLTDDILPIQDAASKFLGLPGHPQIRLWPDLAQYFWGSIDHLERVHPLSDKRRVRIGEGGFGQFSSEPQSIACFYLPERQDLAGSNESSQTEIIPISPRDAVVELVRHSFVPRSAEALGFQPRRLDFFARLARQVPMRRLVYPSGYEHLPAVIQAVLEDLARQSYSKNLPRAKDLGLAHMTIF
jgi:hypothetical protein